jgi:hypothetical protein
VKKKIYHSLSDPSIVYVPLEEARASLAADAAWAEKHIGPDVPARLVLSRGRPKKGSAPTPSAARSVRMQVSLWKGISARADELGISTNAALQMAAAAWMARKSGGRAAG